MKYKKICCCALLIGTAIFTAGCSVPDFSTLFMSEDERSEYYRDKPLFWNQATAVEGSDTLWEVHNDIFSGKPYNNILKFGDTLLLVGEASYHSILSDGLLNTAESDEENYELSFDVYSPWSDRITASLSHSDVNCTSYQVCGDSLFLLNDAEMTLVRYDGNLQETGTYNMSSFEDMDTLTFYPSGSTDSCFAFDSVSGELKQIVFSENSIKCTPVELPYYDLQVLYASPEERTLTVLGISSSTLQETLAIVDTDSFTVTEENTAIGMTDVLAESNLTFLPSGGILVRETIFPETATENSFPLNTFSCYDNNGNGIACVSYDCNNYLSMDAAFFEEDALGFFLVYNADCQPYLLVWDYSQPTSGMDSLDLPDAGQQENGDDQQESPYDTEQEECGDDTEQQENDSAESLYGVEIKYGEDIPDELSVYYLEPCTDEELLSEALDTLYESLGSYPNQFFRQLCFGDNTGITIYLAGTITGSTEGMLETPTGFTDSIDGRMVMVLNTEYLWDWQYTINHEISHMIDRRLEYRASYDEDSLYSEETWSSFNPQDYDYLGTYDGYEENDLYYQYPEYFADSYGTTFATEDRAELFGLAMSDYLEYLDEDEFFIDGSPVVVKYEYYCACIRDGFDTTGWDDVMPWEKILEK
jgi:hypothetical protein